MRRAGPPLLIALLPPLTLGVIAVALSSQAHPTMLRVLLQAAAVGALVTATWRASVLAEQVSDDELSSATEPPIAIERIAADRRRPTIDRDTGLLADWYFRLRVEEELARAERYDQRFTLVRIKAGAAVTQAAITRPLRASLRGVDLVGSVGDETCVLLPSTDRAAARPVLSRLRALAPHCAISAVECPTEASTLAAVLGEEQWTSSQPSWPEPGAA